ncbi:MAG: hypothetical protein ACLFSQ_01870 [Candidatus Zixiibacteriota bacterium]
MKININPDHIKENLKANDKVSRMGDMFFYMMIMAFYPIFLALSVFAAFAYDGKIINALIYGTVFYIALAIATISMRNKIVKGSYHLYVPEKIEGTKREDYSLLSTMILQGRYDEADGEGLQEFTQNPNLDIVAVMGDTFSRYRQYGLARTWYQRGVNIAEGRERLYILDRLREITENHLNDDKRVIMYLEKIASGFPDTDIGQEARERLDYYKKTKSLKKFT